MQHVTLRMALAAPLALLIGAAPAIAQQAAPTPESDPTGVEQANRERELENEIEDYPAPAEGMRQPADRETRIPEALEPAPPAPSAGSKPFAGKSAAARAGSASIDPSEVQRVFGSDTRLIAIDSLDAATITRLQARLQGLGHYKGAVDGVAGPQTRAALAAYSRAQLALEQRLIQQNQLTTDLAEQLGVEPSARGAAPRSAPTPGMGAPDHEPAAPTPPRGSSPLAPQGSAPLPAPGMPLPTPSSAPPGGLPPAPAGGVTPSAPPPSP